MDSGLISSLVPALLQGGPQGIIALLLCVVGWLVFDRKRLIAEIQRKDDKLDKIADEYYKGNLSLAQALESFKHVLFELKAKL